MVNTVTCSQGCDVPVVSGGRRKREEEEGGRGRGRRRKREEEEEGGGGRGRRRKREEEEEGGGGCEAVWLFMKLIETTQATNNIITLVRLDS